MNFSVFKSINMPSFLHIYQKRKEKRASRKTSWLSAPPKSFIIERSSLIPFLHVYTKPPLSNHCFILVLVSAKQIITPRNKKSKSIATIFIYYISPLRFFC